ncbi:MAG: ABC transporter permease [Candidatus Thorarchaeota archaeon]
MSDERTRNWRDSNWYVSITGFWREYRKHRIGLVGIVVLGLFVVIAIGAPIFATHDPGPASKVAPNFLAPQWMATFDPEGVITDQYADDEFLDDGDEQRFVINGTSDAFTTSHHIGTEDTEDEDFSFATINWTHVANDTINWRDPPDETDQLPFANDFAYVYQDFSWEEFNNAPNDVNITIEFAVDLTGSFQSEVYGGRMFKLYLWLIDSSGNWRRIWWSAPPYLDIYTSRRIDLGYFDVVEAWHGMLEENGVQEDPNDTLKIAFGITPTEEFRYHQVTRTTPWQYYNGSVAVHLRRVSVVCFGEYFGILGTTDKGADAWSQLIWGTRISLYIGILATVLSTAVGVVVGMVAGYFGGKTDEVLMRVVDFLLVIPGLPLMMVLAAFLGPSIDTIIVVISILGWTGTSRLIRSQVLAEKNKAYVESARAIGASDTYIIFRHILPNVTPILFANITLGVVGAILAESGLSFLGLTDPSQPSWGRMLADAQGNGGFIEGAWWVVVFPGLMITSISLAFTFVGHTLDQVLNPRLRER